MLNKIKIVTQGFNHIYSRKIIIRLHSIVKSFRPHCLFLILHQTNQCYLFSHLIIYRPHVRYSFLILCVFCPFYDLLMYGQKRYFMPKRVSRRKFKMFIILSMMMAGLFIKLRTHIAQRRV